MFIKKSSPLIALFLFSGCSSMETVDTSRIEEASWQNTTLFEQQGLVAGKALDYLAAKAASGDVKKEEIQQVNVPVASPVPVVMKPEKKVEVCDKEDVEASAAVKGGGSCGKLGTIFDILIKGADECTDQTDDISEESSGKSPSGGCGQVDVVPEQVWPSNATVTANPVGDGNVAIQSSPGATVNYTAGSNDQGGADDDLLRAVTEFISRGPVSPGKLAHDRAIDSAGGIIGGIGDAAVKITGIGVLGSFAAGAVEAAGDRYDTSGDFGSQDHDESAGSHIVTRPVIAVEGVEE